MPEIVHLILAIFTSISATVIFSAPFIVSFFRRNKYNKFKKTCCCNVEEKEMNISDYWVSNEDSNFLDQHNKICQKCLCYIKVKCIKKGYKKFKLLGKEITFNN